ncbi:MAG: hypothetical protein LM580_09420 [Thermofilum sp.]|nr:hypothetical protein [Thermofilum sp.]
MSLRLRILEYLEKYPSVGSLRLVFDLAPPELMPGTREWERFREEVERAVRELEELGLVEYVEPGIVNYKPFFEEVKWVRARGEPHPRAEAAPEAPRSEPTAVGAGRTKRKTATLESFLGGESGG